MNESSDREELASFLMRLRANRIGDQRLLEAVESAPRPRFVPSGSGRFYSDRSLPLECGETMPGALFAVQLVHALRIAPGQRILEVGTGSGYVTALLALLGGRLVSIERYRRLIENAEARLRSIGLSNVTFVREDGRHGYGQGAPFDRVIVHAALEEAPRQFLDQLAPHGTMICAIGPGAGLQTLARLSKVGSRFEREDLRGVRYQPLAFGTPVVL